MRSRLMENKEISDAIHVSNRSSIEKYPKDMSIRFGVLGNIAPKMYLLD